MFDAKSPSKNWGRYWFEVFKGDVGDCVGEPSDIGSGEDIVGLII